MCVNGVLVCDPVHRNQFRFFPKYLCQTPLDRHRLPTDGGFKSSFRPLSDTLALWKQNQHCDEKGVSSRKDFRWYEAFLPARGRENQGRSAWLDAADYADWRSCPAGPSRWGNPQGCGHFVNSPHSRTITCTTEAGNCCLIHLFYCGDLAERYFVSPQHTM